MENIYKKVFDLKKHIGKISKDSENPFHNSMYFDINKLLSVLEPLLEERNILLIQPVINGDVVTKLIDLDSKEEITSILSLTENKDPQKIGACITYFRRYTLKSLIGIQEEDCDGNKAVDRHKKTNANIIKREIKASEVSEKWNGKLYKKDTIIYIDGEEILPPSEQIEKLKLHEKYKS